MGVEKTYIVDPRKLLPDDWQEMRDRKSLLATSASAIKWSFVKRFDSTEECLKHLERNRFVSIITSPHIKSQHNVVLHDADYTKYYKLAVWFGNESKGISDLAVKHSTMCINIPMFGMIESLNLGTTSGIVLYEITKQRRAYQQMYTYRNKRGPTVIVQPVVATSPQSLAKAHQSFMSPLVTLASGGSSDTCHSDETVMPKRSSSRQRSGHQTPALSSTFAAPEKLKPDHWARRW